MSMRYDSFPVAAREATFDRVLVQGNAGVHSGFHVSLLII
jgi:hypothetical protein